MDEALGAVVTIVLGILRAALVLSFELTMDLLTLLPWPWQTRKAEGDATSGSSGRKTGDSAQG